MELVWLYTNSPFIISSDGPLPPLPPPPRSPLGEKECGWWRFDDVGEPPLPPEEVKALKPWGAVLLWLVHNKGNT